MFRLQEIQQAEEEIIIRVQGFEDSRVLVKK